MQLEIRRASAGDAAGIAEVHVRTWQAAYEHAFGPERLARIDVDHWAARWARELAAGATPFVADVAGRVVAFASLGGGELLALYALPEVWGSGAAAGLMRVCEAAFREEGREEATLWVLEDNPRARRFYEREGWELDGARKEEELLGVRVTEVRYTLRLG